jgi:hypothetical protein
MPGQRAVRRDVVPLWEPTLVTRLCSEWKSAVCSRAVGTYAFASSLSRCKACSACSPGSSFSVKACHPQTGPLYHKDQLAHIGEGLTDCSAHRNLPDRISANTLWKQGHYRNRLVMFSQPAATTAL